MQIDLSIHRIFLSTTVYFSRDQNNTRQIRSCVLLKDRKRQGEQPHLQACWLHRTWGWRPRHKGQCPPARTTANEWVTETSHRLLNIFPLWPTLSSPAKRTIYFVSRPFPHASLWIAFPGMPILLNRDKQKINKKPEGRGPSSGVAETRRANPRAACFKAQLSPGQNGALLSTWTLGAQVTAVISDRADWSARNLASKTYLLSSEAC